MKIKYLGTAAAEGYPALFCECERCVKARKLGGKNIRTRSQSIINDELVIEWSADAFYHSIKYGIDFTYTKVLIVTHIHGDHFQPEDIANRQRYYAQLKDAEPLTVYGSEDLIRFEDILKPDDNYGARVKVLSPFNIYDIEGYNITPLPACHSTEHPYIYIIEKDGKSVLWAHDTGLLKPEVLKYIESSKVVFNMVSLDCTNGSNPGSNIGHMNFEGNRIVKEELIKIGAANDKTIFVINHFSHNGGDTLYEDAERVANQMGMISSYDGMEVEI